MLIPGSLLQPKVRNILMTAPEVPNCPFRPVAVVVLGLLCLAPAVTFADPDNARVTMVEAGVEFSGRLRAALQSAMREGGPVAAIEVCHQQAPAIATAVGAERGLLVRRTGVRLRNPGNAADPVDQRLMEDFARQLAGGADPAGLEDLSPTADGRLRYTRAIPVEAVCLACHGETIAPAISAAIKSHYPDDRATGFQTGQLRGLLVVETLNP